MGDWKHGSRVSMLQSPKRIPPKELFHQKETNQTKNSTKSLKSELFILNFGKNETA